MHDVASYPLGDRNARARRASDRTAITRRRDELPIQRPLCTGSANQPPRTGAARRPLNGHHMPGGTRYPLNGHYAPARRISHHVPARRGGHSTATTCPAGPDTHSTATTWMRPGTTRYPLNGHYAPARRISHHVPARRGGHSTATTCPAGPDTHSMATTYARHDQIPTQRPPCTGSAKQPPRTGAARRPLNGHHMPGRTRYPLNGHHLDAARHDQIPARWPPCAGVVGRPLDGDSGCRLRPVAQEGVAGGSWQSGRLGCGQAYASPRVCFSATSALRDMSAMAALRVASAS